MIVDLRHESTATCPSYVPGCVMYLLEIEIEIGIECPADM